MRPHDWQLRLGALFEQRQGQPFAWGERDCCLWAADVVLTITGADPADGLRGTYGTAEGAADLIEQLGGLAAVCEQTLGEEITPAQAQHGDVGLVNEGPVGQALVAWLGVWIGQGADGLIPVRPEAVVRAWRCIRG